MTKREFQQLVDRSVSDEDYSVIEMVYTWHPVISNVSGKEEVAELYKNFGMAIFHDMLPRAKDACRLDGSLRWAQGEVARIQREIDELSCGFIEKRETLPVHNN